MATTPSPGPLWTHYYIWWAAGCHLFLHLCTDISFFNISRHYPPHHFPLHYTYTHAPTFTPCTTVRRRAHFTHRGHSDTKQAWILNTTFGFLPCPLLVGRFGFFIIPRLAFSFITYLLLFLPDVLIRLGRVPYFRRLVGLRTGIPLPALPRPSAHTMATPVWFGGRVRLWNTVSAVQRAWFARGCRAGCGAEQGAGAGDDGLPAPHGLVPRTRFPSTPHPLPPPFPTPLYCLPHISRVWFGGAPCRTPGLYRACDAAPGR